MYDVSYLGTVDNHGNTEITETVIFFKCRDFAKMLCFLPKCRSFTFSQEYFVCYQHNLSLLCEFNTKIFTFPLPLLPKSVSFVTYWRNM